MELLRNRGEGTACVLTQTNEEAVILVALLRKRGVRSKLIQSMQSSNEIPIVIVRTSRFSSEIM